MMEKTVFQVAFAPRPQRQPMPQADGDDVIEFMISPNPGEPLKPLSKIASGGELSRLMLAIKSLDLAALGRLREIVDLQEFYLGKGDLVKAHLLDSDFHAMLYEMSDSRPLTQTLTSFHNYIQRAREMSFQSRGRAEESIREHRAIVDAMERRDVPAAEKAVETHILNARHNLMATRAGKAAEGVE